MVPIYRTDGEWVAVYEAGHLYNVDADWIGFLIGREVFDPQGHYVGFLSDDRRLLRKRADSNVPADRRPPPRPVAPRIPGSMPLAPMLRDLPYSLVDIFQEEPERFRYISDTRPDMDGF